MPEKPNPGTILIVEDDLQHVALVRRAFAKARIKNPIQHVENGDAALAYVEGVGDYADRAAHPLPVLILLDLNMPKMGGLQFLQWIRSRRALRRVPVVVFTADERPETMGAAYDLGANSYLVKPAKSTDILHLVDKLAEYWLSLNRADGVVLQLKAAHARG